MARTPAQLLEESIRRNRPRAEFVPHGGLPKSTMRNTGTPVVFKVIGWHKNANAPQSTLDYIAKKTDEIFNETFEQLTPEQAQQDIGNWKMVADEDNRKKNIDLTKPIKNSEDALGHRQSGHFIVSLPTNTTEHRFAFENAIRTTLGESLEGHKYVWAIHDDTDHLHAHIVLKTKNDYTGKQIRLGKAEVRGLTEMFYNKCKEEGIPLPDYTKEPERREKAPEKKIRQPPPLPDFILKTAPKWAMMYESKKFKTLKAPTLTEKRLRALGMKTPQQVHSFLNLYQENPKLAIWAVNKNPKLFGIEKPKEPFTMRKIKIEEKEKGMGR